MKKHTWMVAGVLAGGALLAGGRTLRAGNDDPALLRASGPAGLDKFWAGHRAEIEAHSASLRTANYSSDARWHLLSEQLDAIAGQHDAWASHLYWFTDFNAAKAAAKAQHKPILSLRMLGKLTDEYSCANSRFFRTALYANTQISQTMRENFILFWSSERPVPVVTIDMGDGRILKRTLTGNSAHYLLDSAGRPLDVLPGLYGPDAFATWLEQGELLFKACDGLAGAERSAKLKAWHEAEIGNIADTYIESVKATSPEWREQPNYRNNLLGGLRNIALLETKSQAEVEARIAGQLTASKSLFETSTLNATALYSMRTPFSREQMGYWIGMTPYLDKCRLDANSRFLLRSQHPVLDSTPLPSELNSPSASVPVRLVRKEATVNPPTDPFERIVDKFERSMAVDTQRNEWNFHAPLHQWFITHEVNDFDELNRIIYDKLFLTPKSDAWLGLSPAGTYTGLADGGQFQASNSARQAKAGAK